MDIYHIALFLHIVTLMVAASATAITKLAVGRRARARARPAAWSRKATASSRTNRSLNVLELLFTDIIKGEI